MYVIVVAFVVVLVVGGDAFVVCLVFAFVIIRVLVLLVVLICFMLLYLETVIGLVTVTLLANC